MKKIGILFVLLNFLFCLNAQWTQPNAGADVSVKSCREFTLDGSKSKNPLYPDMSFKWVHPIDFEMTQNGEKAKFVAPDVSKPTTFYFLLYTYNYNNISEPDEVLVTVIPNDSIAKPSLVVDNTTITLTNSSNWFVSLAGSTDPYNLPLKVSGILLDGKEKITNYYNLGFGHDVPVNNLATETFIYKIVVKNCKLASEPTTISVNVNRDAAYLNQKPTITANSNGPNELLDTLFVVGDTIKLNAVASDILNRTLTYSWVSLDGIVLSSDNKKETWFVAPSVSNSTEYRFVAIVDNGSTQSVPDTLVTRVSTIADKAKSWVCFAYNDLQSIFGRDFQMVYYAIDDRSVIEGGSYSEFKNLKISKNNQTCHNLFDKFTKIVYRMNEAIEIIDNYSLDDNLKKSLTAEAKFLRALANFYLVTMFKNPPLYNEPRTFGYYDYNARLRVLKYGFKPDTIYESTEVSFYLQIKKDLSDAFSDLPVIRDSIEKRRATKGAALSLLGKACLYSQDWSGAVSAFQQVVDSSWYSLMQPLKNDSASYVDAYNSNFMDSNPIYGYKTEYNNESVFEVEFNRNPVTSWNIYLPGYSSEGNLLNSYFGVNGYQNIGTNKILENQFEKLSSHPAGMKKDPRLYATIYRTNDSIKKMEPLEYSKVLYEVPYKFISNNGLKKYYSPLRKNHMETNLGDGNNWRLIRYSDVLLMYAEALYHNGNEAEAWNQLNKVRNRVGLPNASGDFPKVLMHERDVELAMECVRFFDIVRWHKLPQPWLKCDTIINGFVIGKSEFLPISDGFYTPYFTHYKRNNLAVTEVLGTVKAHDPDGDDNKITYAILPINNNNDYFYMVGNSIRFRYSATQLLNMGVDTTLPFYFYVSAIDEDGLRGSITIQYAFKDIPITLSVPQLINESVSVYPNPTSSSITISNTSDISKIIIFDINGKIMEIIKNDGKSEVSISIERYPVGIYFVYMMGDNMIPVTKKIVKQ